MDGNNSRHFSCSPGSVGSICPELTEHLRLETKYFSNFRALHIHYNLPCHSCFQLTLILRSACKSLALKHTRISWVKVKTADRQTQADRAVPVLLPGSPLILSGPSLLLHVPCQIPASRTGNSFSTQLYNVLCRVTTARLT